MNKAKFASMRKVLTVGSLYIEIRMGLVEMLSMVGAIVWWQEDFIGRKLRVPWRARRTIRVLIQMAITFNELGTTRRQSQMTYLDYALGWDSLEKDCLPDTIEGT